MLWSQHLVDSDSVGVKGSTSPALRINGEASKLDKWAASGELAVLNLEKQTNQDYKVKPRKRTSRPHRSNQKICGWQQGHFLPASEEAEGNCGAQRVLDIVDQSLEQMLDWEAQVLKPKSPDRNIALEETQVNWNQGSGKREQIKDENPNQGLGKVKVNRNPEKVGEYQEAQEVDHS